MSSSRCALQIARSKRIKPQLPGRTSLKLAETPHLFHIQFSKHACLKSELKTSCLGLCSRQCFLPVALLAVSLLTDGVICTWRVVLVDWMWTCLMWQDTRIFIRRWHWNIHRNLSWWRSMHTIHSQIHKTLQWLLLLDVDWLWLW